MSSLQVQRTGNECPTSVVKLWQHWVSKRNVQHSLGVVRSCTGLVHEADRPRQAPASAASDTTAVLSTCIAHPSERGSEMRVEVYYPHPELRFFLRGDGTGTGRSW